MSICIAVPKHLMYILLFSHLKTGIQGPINIIISLHPKNYVIITINRLIVKYLTIMIIRLLYTKIYSKLNNNNAM